jgi:hypothetical protein
VGNEGWKYEGERMIRVKDDQRCNNKKEAHGSSGATLIRRCKTGHDCGSFGWSFKVKGYERVIEGL